MQATKVLCLPDLHAPYHDRGAVKVVKQFQEDFKPHVTIAMGDWVDGTPMSTYAKDVALFDQLEEFEAANELLDLFKPQVFIEGNHEHRFRRPTWPQDIRRLLDPRRWLHLRKRKIIWVPYSSFERDVYRVGGLAFVHGFATNQYAAAKEASRFGNVVHGHTHRVQSLTVPAPYGRVTGYNIGCLCDLHQEYAAVRHPNGWCHGFGFGYIYKSGHHSFTIVRLEGDRVTIEGKEYKL